MHTMLIVKKHPDGYHYVPFDHDPHPSRKAIVDGYIRALLEEGHEVEIVHGFRHRPNPHPSDFHIKLKSGPRSHLGEQP